MSAKQYTIPTSNLAGQPVAYTAATQAWVRTTRLLALNETGAYNNLRYTNDHEDSRDLNTGGGWVHGEWDPGWTHGDQVHLSQDQLALQLYIAPYPHSIPDVRMRERDEESTDEESSMHTRTMRTATGINEGDEIEDDRSTVRAFFEDTVDILDEAMDECSDRDSLFSASSSGSTPRPNSPQVPILAKRKWTRDPDYDYGIDFSDEEHEEVGEPSSALRRCLKEVKISKFERENGYASSVDEEEVDDEDAVEQLVLFGADKVEDEDAVEQLVLFGADKVEDDPDELEEGEIADLPYTDVTEEAPPLPTHGAMTRGWTARRGGMSINPSWQGSSSFH